LPIMLAIMLLSINIACQAPEKSQSTPPSNPAPATTAPSGTPGTNNTQGNAPASSSAVTLNIKSINVTSPSRPEVTIYPPTDKPSENTTVSARVWETLDFECIAVDQASHKLTYIWSCSAGKFRGDSSKVTWTAPGAGGDYTVTVNVVCDQGESAALPFNVNVRCCGN
jgi:hypothetical protein